MMDRRNFVRAVAGAALGAGCVGIASGCGGLSYVTASPIERGVRVLLADLAGLEYALVQMPGRRAPVFLFNTDDGDFAAVSMRCTHRGCTVQPAGSELECPCHGSRFRQTGERLEGPAEEDLETLVVEVYGDSVTILEAT